MKRPDERPIPDKAVKLERINAGFARGVPHNEALDMMVVDFGRTWAETEVPWREELVGNPETGVVHGGVITTLMDAGCGAAVIIALKKPMRIATLDLRIDYLKPARPFEKVVCFAECFKITRHIAFTRAVCHQGDMADPIASAAGTFIIFRDADPGRPPRRSSAPPPTDPDPTEPEGVS